MSLNIKNAESEQLARRLAAATGESVTRAITVAIRERLDRLESDDRASVEARRARLRKIIGDAAGRWIEPFRSTDHGDLLYDDQVLPR